MSEGGQPAAGFYRGCRGVEGSAQYAMTSESGNEQIALDVYVPELERTFTTFLYFSERATPYAIERLRALGWTGEDITDLTGIGDKDVDVQIKYETYKGETRMKVEIATGGGRIKLENQMGDAEKRAFAARMKSVLRGTGGAKPAGAPRPPARPPTSPAQGTTRHTEGAYDPGPPADDDPLPF